MQSHNWFHVSDGLYFRRTEEGDVEIGSGPDFDHVTVVQTIAPSSWASVVSSVCKRGEDHTTWTEALSFHQA